MNNVNISGRITNDIQLNITKSGNPVCSFAVAVDRPSGKGATDFIDCIAWGQTAGFISKHFEKGDGIEVTGTLVTSVYEDKDGHKRKRMQVNCGIIGFPKGRKKRSEDTEANSETAAAESATPEYPASQMPSMPLSAADIEGAVNDDDCPF